MPERAVEVTLDAVERGDRDEKAEVEDDVLERLRRERKSKEAWTGDPDAVRAVCVAVHLFEQRPHTIEKAKFSIPKKISR